MLGAWPHDRKWRTHNSGAPEGPIIYPSNPEPSPGASRNCRAGEPERAPKNCGAHSGRSRVVPEGVGDPESRLPDRPRAAGDSRAGAQPAGSGPATREALERPGVTLPDQRQWRELEFAPGWIG
ncbi:hypothetical protein NDU88_003678 [Pleurodeles waltl]|uniref:Uncharacterized protein n=1 Tax=Pleurodeles waltl TaxID=8319 RepID=A0AAV7KYR6_PLEWA|nr:hypothetical protein NDU88_003678 [Pleurodeles waltl]